MLSTTWASIFFIVPAVLLNPFANKLLKGKFNFDNKNWIKVCSAIIPFLIYSFAVPATSTATNPALVSSSLSSTILASSSEPSVSSTISSSFVLSSSLPVSSSQSTVSSGITLTKATAAPSSGAKLKVHYIDVGQGDSEFLELPNSQTMLIDAGNPENGSQIVSYIKSLGHTKIDYLIATHPHSDHIGGMATVVNGLDIGKVYMPKVSSNTKTFEGLLTAIKNKGLQVNTAKAGLNLLKAGNLNIDMIAPVGTSFDDLNQYSAVIKVTYGDNKFLFMGDAGNVSEAQITADVKADVLKVGHHGSNTATSQAFINNVHPKYAVIEVGKGNTYGHPTAATLQKLQDIGATVYRTDNDGTIIFTSDAKTITIDKKSSSVQQQAPPTTSSSPTTSKAAIVAPSTNDQNVTVYITDSGTKYHIESCRTLKKSKHAITLKEAKAKGYTACGICHPPQ
jgi:competence protein ComEC